MLLRLVIFGVCLATLLEVTLSQKKDKYQQKLKLENEDDLSLLNENKDLNLPQKSKLATINKLIKSSKLDIGSKKINQKEFKQNRTNVEFIKNGNRTIVRDKATNATLDEIDSDDEFGNQHWYWWG